MKHTGFLKQIKYMSISMSVITLIVGLMLVVFPSISVNVFWYMIGAVTIIFGIIKTVGYFAKDSYNLNFQFDLAIGIFMIVIGTVIMIHPVKIVALTHILIGVIILIIGLFRLQTAFDAKHFGLSKWWLILVSSILLITFSVLMIVHPFDAVMEIVRIIGIALVFMAVENLFMVLYTVRIKKRIGPITVEYEEI